MIYELKITLRDVGRPVWRKVRIDEDATFNDLHKLIQVSFGWLDMHLHSFFPNQVNGKQVDRIEIKDAETIEIDQDMSPLFSNDSYDQESEKLADWFVQLKDKVVYIYDFGDDWAHDIVLMKKVKPKKNASYPHCIGAKNVAPEEDSRMEVITGQATYPDYTSEEIVNEINDVLNTGGKPIIREDSVEHELLVKAKEFYQQKPWEYMADDQIFLVVDSNSGESYYCSVIGAGGNTFGLAVYVGQEGLLTLHDLWSGVKSNFDLLLEQHSLLLTFEDREDLQKEDYQFVKDNNVTFRGRKAWPVFISYQPGYTPWFIDDNEVIAFREVLEQAIEVCREVQAGMALPDLLKEDKLLARVFKDNNYKNEIVALDYPEQEIEVEAVPLEVSEIELKRAQKINRIYTAVIEFSIFHIDMPVQDHPDDRPVFPVMAMAADHAKGFVLYQDMVYSSKDYGALQGNLLKAILEIGGKPEKILMDPKTALIMDSVIDALGLHVEIHDSLGAVESFKNQLMAEFGS
ncbi:plasmid pRiA4b ORF-3 family protein [Virgibacillus necropolis]|uniref:plasmid pRiA4b ORF-3 family protein n=1 Tax=Virgibacillus necropolis TaxID=163877 RepID=UPI00384DC16F